MPDERKIDLGGGRSTITSRPILEHAEFQAQARAAGWRFVCPRCGNVASCKDFSDIGGDPTHAAMECIGRAQHPSPTDPWWDTVKTEEGVTPCDWVAFGLFGTLGKGLFVRTPDDTVVECFAIADPA